MEGDAEAETETEEIKAYLKGVSVGAHPTIPLLPLMPLIIVSEAIH